MKVAVTLSSRDYDAVLFDLDGVLARTARVRRAVVSREAASGEVPGQPTPRTAHVPPLTGCGTRKSRTRRARTASHQRMLGRYRNGTPGRRSTSGPLDSRARSKHRRTRSPSRPRPAGSTAEPPYTRALPQHTSVQHPPRSS